MVAPPNIFPSLRVEDEEQKPIVSTSDDDVDEDELAAGDDGDDSDASLDGEQGPPESLFNIQNRIKRARTTSKSIRELYDMMRNKTINMNPPYQREAVWPQPRQLGLVDSIFVGAAIPALVFSVTTDADGNEHRNVIDGKQRLTTIRRFMDGEFSYRNKKNTRNKHYYWKIKPSVSNKAVSFRVPDKERQWFQDTQIPCIDFHDIPLEHEEDIFTRIQQGMVLAGGEKTSVGDTPRREFIRELVKTYFRNPSSPVPSLIDIDINRKRDFTNLSAFVYCCEELPHERAKPTHDSRLKWLNRPDEVDKSFRKKIYDAMDDFWRIVRHHNRPFVSVQQRVAPVEFCFIGVYFFVTHGQNIDDATLSNEILQMRQKVHSEFHGVVKMNTSLFQWWWKELDEVASRPENGDQRLPLLLDPMDPAPPKGARQRKIIAKRTLAANAATAAAAAAAATVNGVSPVKAEPDDTEFRLPPTTPSRNFAVQFLGQPRDAGPSTQKRRRLAAQREVDDSEEDRPLPYFITPRARGSKSPVKRARIEDSD